MSPHLGVDSGEWPNEADPATGHLVNKNGGIPGKDPEPSPSHLRYYRCCCSMGSEHKCCFSNDSLPDNVQMFWTQCMYDEDCDSLIRSGAWSGSHIRIGPIGSAKWEWASFGDAPACSGWVTKEKVRVVDRLWGQVSDVYPLQCPNPGTGSFYARNVNADYYVKLWYEDLGGSPYDDRWVIAYGDNKDCSTTGGREFAMDYDAIPETLLNFTVPRMDGCCGFSQSGTSDCQEVDPVAGPAGPTGWYAKASYNSRVDVTNNYCCQCEPTGTSQCVKTSDESEAVCDSNKQNACTDGSGDSADQDEFCV